MTSQPRGAVIALDGRAVGITPASVNVERSQQHMTLRYTKEGYNPDEIGLRREFNWLTPIEDYGGCFAFTFLYYLARYRVDGVGYLATSALFSSLLYGSPIFAIDAITGAIWKQSPPAAEVVLSRAAEPPPASLEPATAGATLSIAPALSASVPALSATQAP